VIPCSSNRTSRVRPHSVTSFILPVQEAESGWLALDLVMVLEQGLVSDPARAVTAESA
jgi:hypothetical protein